MYNELEENETKKVRNLLGDFRLLMASAISTETQLYGDVHWVQLPQAMTDASTLFKHGHGKESYEIFKRTLCTPPLPEETAEGDSTQSSNQLVEEDQVEPITVESAEDRVEPITAESAEDKSEQVEIHFYSAAAQA